MRQFVFATLALLISLGGSSPFLASQPPGSGMWVTLKAEAGGSASVSVARSEIYIADGPLAGVGSRPPAGSDTSPVMFNIRAWKEVQKARVVVYAWLKDERAPGGATETPI